MSALIDNVHWITTSTF